MIKKRLHRGYAYVKVAFLYIIVVISKQNSSKTASKISKTDFYFVTGFYSLCDICMGHEEHDFFRQKDMKDMIF